MRFNPCSPLEDSHFIYKTAQLCKLYTKYKILLCPTP